MKTSNSDTPLLLPGEPIGDCNESGLIMKVHCFKWWKSGGFTKSNWKGVTASIDMRHGQLYAILNLKTKSLRYAHFWGIPYQGERQVNDH